MRDLVAQTLFVRVIPEPASDMDEVDLATELEKACFHDRVLEGAYRRRFVESDSQPLGLSWSGILEFWVKSRDHIKALCKALLFAFPRKRVKIRIETKENTLELEALDHELDELQQLVEGLCKSVDRMK